MSRRPRNVTSASFGRRCAPPNKLGVRFHERSITLPIEPHLFSQNEAWLLFRLTEAPIRTEEDGDFNVFALMDVATGLILGMEFVEASASEPSELQSRRLLSGAEGSAGCRPKLVYIDSSQDLESFTASLSALRIEARPELDEHLAPLTLEAREGFLTHLAGGELQ